MGVTIAAGNDGGAPLVEIGEMADEIALYVKHGFSPQQALESATINTARLFRLPELGYLDEGWHADVLVVDGDPLADALALKRPSVVIKAGSIVARDGVLVA
jgi:imidazolonepropionase-like amidohydrolase